MVALAGYTGTTVPISRSAPVGRIIPLAAAAGPVLCLGQSERGLYQDQQDQEQCGQGRGSFHVRGYYYSKAGQLIMRLLALPFRHGVIAKTTSWVLELATRKREVVMS